MHNDFFLTPSLSVEKRNTHKCCSFIRLKKKIYITYIFSYGNTIFTTFDRNISVKSRQIIEIIHHVSHRYNDSYNILRKVMKY